MKQKTLFKIIILALCIIVLFFVFDKDNNASDNINNISKNDLAFKYDKNDARLESFVDVIDNEENVDGRVLVFNPKPNLPISVNFLIFDDMVRVLNDDGKTLYNFGFDFSNGTEEIVGLHVYIADDHTSMLTSCMSFMFDQSGNKYYNYIPYFVLSTNATKIVIDEMPDDTLEKLRSVLDEILLISKESIFSKGDTY